MKRSHQKLAPLLNAQSFLCGLVFLTLSVGCKFYSGIAQDFVKSSFADFLFVGSVYYLLRSYFSESPGFLTALFVFLLATIVEFLQLSGIAKNPFTPHWLVFWIGDVFDISDIGMYAAGCIFAYLLEQAMVQRS